MNNKIRQHFDPLDRASVVFIKWRAEFFLRHRSDHLIKTVNAALVKIAASLQALMGEYGLQSLRGLPW